MARKLPAVAVVTPVFNGSAFLREAMYSVQAQTYPNIRHFVLDNASTDATPEILREFRDARVPVSVLRNPQVLSLAQNWNRCVALGTGDADYFRLLCADDTIAASSIERMVALAERDPQVAIVGCDQQTSHGTDNFHWDRERSVFEGREAVRSCLLGETGIQASHLLCRSGIRHLRQDFFDETLTVLIDVEAIFFALVRNKNRMGYIPEPLAFSRRHSASVTETVGSSTRAEFFDWQTIILRYAGAVLSSADESRLRRAYRRHYLGKLLSWRFIANNGTAHDWHTRALASIGDTPGLLEKADALADICLRKLRLRKGWNQYPY